MKPNCRKSSADAGGEAAEESGRGRPANAYFPWPEEEKLRLRESHAAGATLEALSDEFERSTWSIAVQLQKMGLIGEEQVAAHR